MKKIKLSLLIIVFTLFQSKAQDFGDVFAAGPEDAQLYVEKFAGPVMASFTNGLGAGWYNTAKPHKLLGFDATVTLNVANIPTGDRTFNFGQAGFQNLTSTEQTLPTLVGGSTEAQLGISGSITITDPTTGQSINYSASEQFDAPSGIDFEGFPVVGFPVPALTVGLGLPKNTELKLRYGSDFGLLGEDASITLFGLGIMHDLKQWIPGLKQIPFDASAFVGYNSFSAEFASESQDVNFRSNSVTELSASSFTLQGVVSKKLAIFTPYVGVGFVIGSSSLDVKGDFIYTEENTGTELTLRDPVSLDFDGGSSPRINAGLRIKLLILTFHAEYVVQKYNTLTAGVGISIR